MKTLLDKDFEYEPSHATDIRKRFDRVRKEIAAAKLARELAEAAAAAAPSKVEPIRKAAK